MEYAGKRVINQTIIMLTAVLALTLVFSWTNYRVHPFAIFRYLGAAAGSTVGMSVGIPENPFNSIARQLEEKEQQLEEREELLQQKELQTQGMIFSARGEIILTLILVIVSLLFFLLLVNFYLDHKERKEKNKQL